MLRKVRIIKSVPKARTGYQVQGSLANDVPAFGGADYNAYIGTHKPQVSKTLTAVPRAAANLEAEGGETVVGNLDGSKMPSFKTIKGPRHSNGGVPLLLPEDSFIFSDTKSMRIVDPKVLNMFGVKPKKGGYTPAELSKKYDINNYRKILQDPESDKVARTTAEIMIKNYVIKLGALALAQESKKAFPQGIPLIARPYMEAMGLRDEDLIPELAMQEEQQMPVQEMEEVEEEFPQEMSSGEPIAQPQPMPQQMPEAGMAPMAQYGMTLGGYDMPFAQDGFVVLKPDGTPFNSDPNYVPPSIPYLPEDIQPYYNLINAPQDELQSISQAELDAWNAANPPEQVEAIIPQQQYGGIPRAEYGMPMGTGMSQNYMGNKKRFYPDGGPTTREMTAAELEERRKTAKQIEKIKGTNCPPGWIKLSDGTCAQGTITSGGGASSSLGQGVAGGGAPNAAWKKLMCDELSRGVPVEELARKRHGSVAGLTAMFKDCIKKGEQVTKEQGATARFAQLEQEPCPCKDKDGKEIPGKFAKRDDKGDCLPCLEECKCKKSDGSTYTVGKDKDGNCEKCSEEEGGDGGMSLETQVREPEWWLQDTVNAAGAFTDLMSIRKRMPWEARVDLEEPRPTFLDPTRELAAQSEQANIAAQASAQFAGPQALGARLSAIQGKGAAAAADTLSRINNQNVGIANQFEGQQVGIRNQEQLMNQQMANRVYDKNVIADQQFQNAKRAGRANMAQAYNTAITNKWKTDALNQMYPDYQVSPSSGGRVYADPRAKDATATQPEMTMEEFVAANKGQDPKVLDRMLQIKYGKKYGGVTTFRDGGFIYTVFPAITL